jgi:hypothetical protein
MLSLREADILTGGPAARVIWCPSAQVWSMAVS